jgi:hypothetical protein
MPSAYNVRREFDYSSLSPNPYRKARRVLAFIVFGSIAGASGIALQMPGQEPSGGSVIAAVSPNPSATSSMIVPPASPAARAPDSRQGSASPSNSAPATPIDAITKAATEPAPTVAATTQPTPTVAATTEPAPTVEIATEPALLAATESPARPVAAPRKPQKTATSVRKAQKTARQNRWNRDWYGAYAWRQPSTDYWRGRGYYHHYARPFW